MAEWEREMSENIIMRGNLITVKKEVVKKSEIRDFLKVNVPEASAAERRYLASLLKAEGVIFNYKTLLELDLILS